MFDKKGFFKFHRNGLLIVLLVCLTGVFPVFSLTDSLAHHAFVASKYNHNINRNDYVLFKAKLPGETTQKQLLKQVVGVPGDTIAIKNGQCFINEHPVGTIQLNTLSGQTLNPLQPQTIPEGKLFVAGNHERSFDSRYQELGLINIQEVSKAYAIF